MYYYIFQKLILTFYNATTSYLYIKIIRFILLYECLLKNFHNDTEGVSRVCIDLTFDRSCSAIFGGVNSV